MASAGMPLAESVFLLKRTALLKINGWEDKGSLIVHILICFSSVRGKCSAVTSFELKLQQKM